MKTPISCILTAALAATVALGCRTDDDAVAVARPDQPVPAAEPVAAEEQVVADGPGAAEEPVVADQPAAAEQQVVADGPAPAVHAPAVRVQAVPAQAVQDPKRAPKQDPEQDPRQDPKQDDGRFLDNAFPPTVPDTEWHQDAWGKQDCLRCHETGVGEAPELVHRDMPDILMTAACRTCHVFVPGSKPRPKPKVPADERFEENAFPPMMPASEYHQRAWLRTDCLLCHENGIKGAPGIVHEGMASLLLASKCRTCHVQVRVVDLKSN